MLISDWSSDVCSSDLLASVQEEVPHSWHDRLVLSRGAGHVCGRLAAKRTSLAYSLRQEQQRSEAMRELWKLWTAAMIGLCLATLPLASAAAAQAAPAAAPENSPSDLDREGLESTLRTLRLLAEGVTQYELTEE